LILRPSKQGDDQCLTGTRQSHSIASRGHVNLACLQSSEGQQYTLHRAQFSLVVCGLHDDRWTAYSLVDGKLDPEDEIETEYTNQPDVHTPDPATPWGGRLADRMLSDPREHFLWVVQMRAKQAVLEYENIVRFIQRRMFEHV
jgi:hypothetical protein